MGMKVKKRNIAAAAAAAIVPIAARNAANGNKFLQSDPSLRITFCQILGHHLLKTYF
jgi:hypothetical protein